MSLSSSRFVLCWTEHSSPSYSCLFKEFLQRRLVQNKIFFYVEKKSSTSSTTGFIFFVVVVVVLFLKWRTKRGKSLIEWNLELAVIMGRLCCYSCLDAINRLTPVNKDAVISFIWTNQVIFFIERKWSMCINAACLECQLRGMEQL